MKYKIETQKNDATQLPVVKQRTRPIPLTDQQKFNYKAFGTLNAPSPKQTFFSNNKPSTESLLSKKIAESNVNNRELTQKLSEQQKIDKEREYKVAPEILMAAAATATGTLPEYIGGRIAGKGVDKATEKISGGKYKTWGEAALPEAPMIGDLTNPGYLVGGIRLSYGNRAANMATTTKTLESEMPMSSKYVSQEDKVNRMLAKKDLVRDATSKINQLSTKEILNPFVVEDTGLGGRQDNIINLLNKKNNPGMDYDSFINATKTWRQKRNDDMAGGISNLGKASHNQYWGITNDRFGVSDNAHFLDKHAYETIFGNSSKEQRLITENHIKNHELDHFLYKNSRKEYDDIAEAFDVSKFGASKNYLVGKKSTIAGDEIRARMGQLMDYFNFKYNPKTNRVEDLIGNSQFTRKHLDYAIKNYSKDVNLDNSMSTMLSAIKDKDKFVKIMNNRALSAAGVGAAGIYSANKLNKNATK